MTKIKVLVIVLISGVSLVIFILFWIILSNRDEAEVNVYEPASKEINLAELKNHATAQDCWVAVGGVVYDATNVIRNNPDKKAILLEVCGGEGSIVYTVQKTDNQKLDKTEILKLNAELKAKKIGILAP